MKYLLIALIAVAGCGTMPEPATDPVMEAVTEYAAEKEATTGLLTCFTELVQAGLFDRLHWTPSEPGDFPVVGYNFRIEGFVADTSMTFILIGAVGDTMQTQGVDLMGNVSEWSEWSDVR